MAQLTIAQRLSTLEKGLATLVDALTAAQATTAAVGAPVTAQAAAPTFVKGKRDESGNVAGGFACTVDPTCIRFTRTAKRAAVHGTEAGHEFRTA